MNNFRTIILSLLIVIWIGFLLFEPSQPPAECLGRISHLDKVAHFFAFGILGLLLCCLSLTLRPRTVISLFPVPMLAVTLCGILQELSQTAVPGRTASIPDLLFDMMGASSAILLVNRIKIAGIIILLLMAFSPPAPVLAAANTVRIMPLGDSITAGGDGAYRRPLYYSIRNTTSYSIDYVGTQFRYSSCAECCNDEAYGGWTPAQLLYGVGDVPHLATRLSQLNPQIVIIHAGTNGCDSTAVAYDPETELHGSHVQTIKEILDTIFSHNPQIKVILAQIIQRQAYLPEIHEFNRQLAVMHQNYAHKNSISLVNLESVLIEANDYLDHCHPSEQGYEKMGQALYPSLVSGLAMFTQKSNIIESLIPSINLLLLE